MRDRAALSRGTASSSHSRQLSATVRRLGSDSPYRKQVPFDTSTLTHLRSSASSVSASSKISSPLPRNFPGPFPSVNKYDVLRIAKSAASASCFARSYGQALTLGQ